MKIVIDIPEEEYRLACKYPKGTNILNSEIIKKGTLLPKGYGRLIDADELLKAMDTWDKFGVDANANVVPIIYYFHKNCYVPYVHYEDMIKSVSNAPTIIEAEEDTE